MPFKKGNIVYRLKGDKVLLDETFVVIDSHNEGDGEYYTIKQILDKEDDTIPREVNVEVYHHTASFFFFFFRNYLLIIIFLFFNKKNIGKSNYKNSKSKNARYKRKRVVSKFR